MKNIQMAFRNLSRQKKRSILLGTAIAFGVMVVMIMYGLVGAITGNIGENVANLAAGHIFIEGTEKSVSGKDLSLVRDDSILMEALEKSKVPYKYISKRSEFSGTLVYSGKSVMQGITGVDFTKEAYMFDRLSLKEGSFEKMSEKDALILSDPIAKKLKVSIGDRVRIQLKTYTGQDNLAEFAVVAIVHDSGLFSSISAYANLSYVNELLNIPEGKYQSFGIFLGSVDNMNKYADMILTELKTTAQVFSRDVKAGTGNPYAALINQAKKETWTGTKYRIITINDLLQQIDVLVANVNLVALVFLIILFIIIMVGLGNTFRMIMYERTKEIGTMRAMGMQKKQVRNLFLWEGLLLSVMGTLAGILLAIILLSGFSFIDFGVKNDFSIIMKNGHVTYAIQAAQVIITILLISGMTLFAVYWPARKAAKLTPAAALRSGK